MLFQPFELKNIKLKNRVVMPPMCMYSAKEDGKVTPFHLAHYQARAIGGVALIIQESTAVLPDGRITVNDLGIWDDDHISGLKQIVSIIKEFGAVPGIQINHAGRKAKVEHPIGPSAVGYGGDYKIPTEMTKKEIKEVVDAFKQAARRADEAGYELLEIHGAHGYLIFQFLSPLSNHRTDEYQDGSRFLYEVVEAINKVWPKEKVLALRVSANEYVKDGVTPEMISEAINKVKHLGLDLIDVSSGGNVLVKIPAYPGYQLHLAKKVKELTELPVIGGGLVTELELAEYAVSSLSCDLVYLGRVLLREPYLVINHAKDFNVDINYPEQYIRGKK
jgi:NADPH2 dehydrogenase